MCWRTSSSSLSIAITIAAMSSLLSITCASMAASRCKYLLLALADDVDLNLRGRVAESDGGGDRARGHDQHQRDENADHPLPHLRTPPVLRLLPMQLEVAQLAVSSPFGKLMVIAEPFGVTAFP